MSTEYTLPLESAHDTIAPLAERQSRPASPSVDSLALLTFLLIVILYHVLVPELRTSQIGLSLRADSLRKALTVVLAFGSVGLIITAARTGQSTLIRIFAGLVLVLFTGLASAYSFFNFDGAGSSIATLAEYAALASTLALWQPWRRLNIYLQALRKNALPLLLFIAVLLLWEGIIRVFNIQQFLLPAPSVIASTFMANYPKLIGQGWFTFQNALWGFTFGCGAGILFGMVAARFPRMSRAVMPYAVAANAIPIIAITPIMNQWFGTNEPASKIAVVTLLTFFTAMINTLRGLSSAPNSAVELMRTYAANELQVFAKMRLPYALPYIFSALKVCTTVGMIGAIVAEYFGGPLFGLGVNIADNAALSKFPMVWSQIVIASVLGLAFYFVVSLVERLIMPWHISFRDQSA